ncbi:MAG: 4Fe-4S binding protein [Bacteroidales bacterium]
MKNIDYFRILTDEIHTTIIATVDKNGLPSTRVIDIMLYDEKGIYFLTAKGKLFYQQLKTKPYISVSAVTSGKNSMDKKSITISGAIKNIGTKKLDKIFKKNTYMAEIYPTIKSRKALEVFCLYKGHGEYFDLSTKPITRGDFSFGGEKNKKYGYQILNNCIRCGKCIPVCPQNCIEKGTPYIINQENCLHCGNCLDVCTVNAILKLN